MQPMGGAPEQSSLQIPVTSFYRRFSQKLSRIDLWLAKNPTTAVINYLGW
jgi:hypothetical protein